MTCIELDDAHWVAFALTELLEAEGEHELAQAVLSSIA